MRTPSEQILDEMLVLGCQSGDARAFDALVARWQERLWRHAARLIEDEDAAYDVLQESWLAIGKGLPGLQDAVAFPAWAYRIVSNKSRDWLRRERRRRRGHELYAETVADNGAFDCADIDERCHSVRAAMQRLTGPDRALLALKYEESFDTGRRRGRNAIRGNGRGDASLSGRHGAL
jgi:RNA polymerase sigma-70 factor (ECF subfamily)